MVEYPRGDSVLPAMTDGQTFLFLASAITLGVAIYLIGVAVKKDRDN